MESSSQLDYRELSTYKALFLDYINDYGRLGPFFAGDPQEPSSWRRIAEKLDDHPGNRTRVAHSLRIINRNLGADSEALETIDALEQGALVIITGQQVGLFGGPLYTLYKALTAAELARHASEQLNRRVVPLFWMDADDHDFDEVSQVHLLDSRHELVTLNYDPPETEARIPVARHRLEPAIDDMVAQAEASLPPSEFKQDVIEVLKDCYAVGHTLCAAFGSLLLTMTRGTGLAVVHPAAPELKEIAATLFEREVAERSESSRIVQRTTEELVSLGYHAQVQVNAAADRLNLFYAAPGRFHVIAENGGFRIAGDGRLVSADELTRLISSEPDRFSPNVLLRPLFQDTLLPTLAYVSGPSELAYFAQLRGLYEHFGLTMPIIAPRASFTLVEKPQKKFIERYRVELAEIRSNDESLLNRILKEQAPPQLEKDLAEARRCVQELTDTLERDLSAVDPTLGPTVRLTRGKLLHQLNTLETKSLRAIKRKDETLRNQFFSTRSTLFPCFDMQERRISPIQYFSKYGWYFTDMLRKHLDPQARSHVLLYP